ncbi:MAG TPA: helix-turn-helix transcriptional regulator [Conexibacter sp.]|nr:helix-turn-helix transcriptional regulator [Conexibacter sp.]
MEPSPKSVFGRVLRRIRRERDLSQEALAHSAGLARNHVSELERARRDPGLATVVQIADALNMGVGELMTRFDEERARLQGA